jgi:hypothetical protein
VSASSLAGYALGTVSPPLAGQCPWSVWWGRQFTRHSEQWYDMRLPWKIGTRPAAPAVGVNAGIVIVDSRMSAIRALEIR